MAHMGSFPSVHRFHILNVLCHKEAIGKKNRKNFDLIGSFEREQQCHFVTWKQKCFVAPYDVGSFTFQVAG